MRISQCLRASASSGFPPQGLPRSPLSDRTWSGLDPTLPLRRNLVYFFFSAFTLISNFCDTHPLAPSHCHRRLHSTCYGLDVSTTARGEGIVPSIPILLSLSLSHILTESATRILLLLRAPLLLHLRFHHHLSSARIAIVVSDWHLLHQDGNNYR